MSSKYVRDLVRQWAGTVAEAPFYDTINREQNPADGIWFTIQFFAREHEGGTFCKPGYIERGAMDLVFNAPPGLGDGDLLTAMEPAIRSFLANEDPGGKFAFESYDPIEELSAGSADATYRLVMGVNYSYTA